MADSTRSTNGGRDTVTSVVSPLSQRSGGPVIPGTNFSNPGVYIDSVDDGALVRRCLEGEPAAFERLVDRYHRPLFNLAYRLLGSREDAQDATQNAFVKVYEHLESFDRSQRFFSWTYQILRNECLNTLRSRRPSSPLPENLVAGESPDAPLEQRERRAAVQKALLELTVEQREVVLLRHFTELSYDEIAASLGVPAKTVKSRLYSARQRLAVLLAERA